jgi:hypothetical protein
VGLEGGRLVLLAGVGLRVSGETADEDDPVHGIPPSRLWGDLVRGRRSRPG